MFFPQTSSRLNLSINRLSLASIREWIQTREDTTSARPSRCWLDSARVHAITTQGTTKMSTWFVDREAPQYHTQERQKRRHEKGRSLHLEKRSGEHRGKPPRLTNSRQHSGKLAFRLTRSSRAERPTGLQHERIGETRGASRVWHFPNGIGYLATNPHGRDEYCRTRPRGK